MKHVDALFLRLALLRLFSSFQWLDNILEVKWHFPISPTVEQVVCCRMTPLQTELYKHLIQSKVLRMELTKTKSASGMSASSLAFITQLKKLTNRKYILFRAIFSWIQSRDIRLIQQINLSILTSVRLPLP